MKESLTATYGIIVSVYGRIQRAINDSARHRLILKELIIRQTVNHKSIMVDFNHILLYKLKAHFARISLLLLHNRPFCTTTKFKTPKIYLQ